MEAKYVAGAGRRSSSAPRRPARRAGAALHPLPGNDAVEARVGLGARL